MLFPTEEDTEEKNKILALQQVFLKHGKVFSATVHSRVTVRGCSVEYEYKFLHQFARVVAHRMPYTSVLSIYTTLLQGHTKRF